MGSSCRKITWRGPRSASYKAGSPSAGQLCSCPGHWWARPAGQNKRMVWPTVSITQGRRAISKTAVYCPGRWWAHPAANKSVKPCRGRPKAPGQLASAGLNTAWELAKGAQAAPHGPETGQRGSNSQAASLPARGWRGRSLVPCQWSRCKQIAGRQGRRGCEAHMPQSLRT